MLATPAFLAWLAGAWVALVVATPYLGDDVINAKVRENARDQGLGLIGMISYYVRLWMDSQGRFFPGSLAWTFSLHWFAGSRVVFKLTLGAVLLAAVVVVALVVRELTRSWGAAALFVVLAFSCMQLRLGFDGLTSYSGLLPLVVFLTGASLLVLLTRSGLGWGVVAGLLYGLASVTYETVVLFLPALVALVLWKRRRWVLCLPLAVPGIAEFVTALVLRSRLSEAPAAAYTLRFDPPAVGRTLLTQAAAAVPGAQWLFQVAPRPRPSELVVSLVLVGVPAMLAAAWGMRRVVHAPPEEAVPRASCLLLVGFGAWIWLVSSLLVALTKRWQDELGPGGAYLPVVFGFFGVALAAAGCWLGVARFLRRRWQGRLAVWWIFSGAVFVGLIATATFAGNLAVVSLIACPAGGSS